MKKNLWAITIYSRDTQSNASVVDLEFIIAILKRYRI